MKLRFAVPEEPEVNVLVELIEKLPNRLIVPVPVVLAKLRITEADGLIVKLPLTVKVAEPELTNVLVEVILLLIKKLPATVTVLPVPVEDKTRRPEPFTIISPATLNDPLLEESNNLKVPAPVPVAETVKFPPILPSVPAKLIKLPGPFGQFQVK